MIALGVNIDHIATLRQARKTYEPDPVLAVSLVEQAGADGVTVHLREDRRHINERDLRLLRETVSGKLNLEMALHSEIIDIALSVKPDQITLVPEKREEVTTEGGLDCKGQFDSLVPLISRFKDKGIELSIFIDPQSEQIEKAFQAGTDRIELHTGTFANQFFLQRGRSNGEWQKEKDKLFQCARNAYQMNLGVSAGHGLNYLNIKELKHMPYLTEVNIGHAIISRAVFIGLKEAVREMVNLLS